MIWLKKSSTSSDCSRSDIIIFVISPPGSIKMNMFIIIPPISSICYVNQTKLHLLRTRCLYRANLYATVTTNTFAFINLWVFEAFFIFNHTYCIIGTNSIAGCAAATLFFSVIKYWYFFIYHHPTNFLFILFSNRFILFTIPIPLYFLTIKSKS